MNKRLNNNPINQTKSILNYRLLSIAISILILLPGCKAHSQGTCDWPSFHGPDRTNKSEETGLIFTAGKYRDQTYVFAFDLYVRPAGKKGFQVCLDKNDGKLIWANTDIPGVEGYSSAVVFDYGDNKHITGSSSNCYYGVDAATGRLLWKVDFENQQGLNLTDAIAKDGYVFITSGYGKGSMLFRLKASGDKFVPETVWQSGLMDNHHGGVILHNDYLYGSGSNSRGWFCLEFFTGKQIWNNTRGKGAITYADGMLYLLDERSGSMKLVKATPDSYESAGEFNVPSGGQSMYWAHPVVCGKRLYVRHWDKVFVYDIGQ